ITAAIDMFRSGKISAERVRELIKPYHVRQIESDSVDPKSLAALTPFCQGISVLPRSAVSGKAFFSISRARKTAGGEKIILIKERFTPQDAVDMQKVSAICSLSPAAIHVVTAAQNLGIPALLNLEEDGTRLDPANQCLVNRDGLLIREGDWVTVSSRGKSIYMGKAVFAPARLLRFMAGEKVSLTPAERDRFERLAFTYREYRKILECVDASAFESLQDLGHSIRYGRLQKDPAEAPAFVNRCFDINREKLTERLLEVTLGMHLMNLAAFDLLTPDRRVRLLKGALALCREKGISGYQAGAFVIGSLIRPDAPGGFWKAFSPAEIGGLINEWVLHQKYMMILNDVGERQISRARAFILSKGLGSLPVHPGMLKDFMPLKLVRVDLAEVRRALSPNIDSQTAEVLDLLSQPFGRFYDYSSAGSLDRLREVCDSEKVPLPGPEDR
ncbi:MAG: pyruvate, phosphate dikinase, partial [Candidatus Aminicenantes bacterium]|nr:pyruvate, phosphate dikinase [Candidatus Aminicenantes bacterium]